VTQAQRKKVGERIIADAFLRKAGWDCSLVDSERPDFLLPFPTRTVGLELTQVFSDSSPTGSRLREDEQLRHGFLQELTAPYYAQGGAPIQVRATLPDGPLRHWLPDLAVQLREHRPEVAFTSRSFTVTLESGATAIFEVESLPAEAGQYMHWESFGDTSGLVERLDQATLAARVAGKALLLQSYASVVEATRLLVYVDRIRSSGKLEYGFWEPPPQVPSCGFEEVYLFIYPLKVIRVA
jgi:hypothetical protein